MAWIAITPLEAATLDIGATASIVADLTIADGIPPTDIDVSSGFVTVLSGDVDSAVNDPTATQSENDFIQIGVFDDPPQPFINTESDMTSLPDGGTARGLFYVETTISPGPGPRLRPVNLDRVLNGTATLAFPDLAGNASAASGYEVGRDLFLTNNSASITYAFSIDAGFDIALSASADAAGTGSMAEAFFTLAFISSGDIALTLAGPFDEDTGISASDPGTSTTTDLVTSNGLFDGVVFSASAEAIGTGAPTLSELDTTSRFVMNTIMGPGSTLRVRFFQSFNATTHYDDPALPPVSLPGSVLALLSGLAALGMAQRKRHDVRSSLPLH
ncbi:hypothetical protein DKT77_02285 [Meridianimarinicoccus roseus]|uniref:Uncharacterized protein n=2 Tax=Meridianimarinicoccus roseus TaxID=2072018 RepID=A0A2V2LJI2_9RHOB|nr:hypothetical protein DKT77_02285 [Meridianimarinicoccus roseus]